MRSADINKTFNRTPDLEGNPNDCVCDFPAFFCAEPLDFIGRYICYS